MSGRPRQPARPVGTRAGLAVLTELIGRTGAPALIGIDGLGAAGKTTLAERLRELTGAQLVHVDDLSAPGVLPWEVDRFRAEVWAPYRRGEPTAFRRWHWTSGQPGELQLVDPERVLILEGVRATDSTVDAPFALRVWVQAPEEVRLDRARRRDPDRFECWSTTWRPREQAWYRAARPDRQAGLIIDTAIVEEC